MLVLILINKGGKQDGCFWLMLPSAYLTKLSLFNHFQSVLYSSSVKLTLFAAWHSLPDEKLLVDFRRQRIHVRCRKQPGRILPPMASIAFKFEDCKRILFKVNHLTL
jgi:hypothetical protein